MKFNRWSKQRIADGSKRLTSRREPHHADPDIISVVGPLPWWFIKTYLYRDEGASSPAELQRVINQIFRRTVEEHEQFFVHVIRRYQNDKETTRRPS